MLQNQICFTLKSMHYLSDRFCVFRLQIGMGGNFMSDKYSEAQQKRGTGQSQGRLV